MSIKKGCFTRETAFRIYNRIIIALHKDFQKVQ